MMCKNVYKKKLRADFRTCSTIFIGKYIFFMLKLQNSNLMTVLHGR